MAWAGIAYVLPSVVRRHIGAHRPDIPEFLRWVALDDLPEQLVSAIDILALCRDQFGTRRIPLLEETLLDQADDQRQHRHDTHPDREAIPVHGHSPNPAKISASGTPATRNRVIAAI